MGILETNLENLTPEQEEIFEEIDKKLDLDALAEVVFDEDTAYEQWCDSHEDEFEVHYYAGGWNTPPGTYFREVEGPEPDESDLYETTEGEDSYQAAETIIEFFVRNIDEILISYEEDIDEFINKRYEILMEKAMKSCHTNPDKDDLWTLFEHILFN